MTTFTPISSLAGGLLLGVASALLLLGLGRIAGVSGIVGRALFPDSPGDTAWRWAFIVGLPLGAALVAAVQAPLVIDISSGRGTLVAAGLLVGFGTRLGSGCTSGHGVCGISRGSRRSIVATATFMAVAIGTVFVVRHLAGGVA